MNRLCTTMLSLIEDDFVCRDTSDALAMARLFTELNDTITIKNKGEEEYELCASATLDATKMSGDMRSRENRCAHLFDILQKTLGCNAEVCKLPTPKGTAKRVLRYKVAIKAGTDLALLYIYNSNYILKDLYNLFLTLLKN